MTRVHDLRQRIAQLKLRFTENELKVQQAAEAVRAADELASRAEQVNQSLSHLPRCCIGFAAVASFVVRTNEVAQR